MKRLATVGVYGFTGETFMDSLQDAEVALLVDVRQRRGVRGTEYAWANAKRLQTALEQAGIDYEHRPELAPTSELRQLQYAEDDRQGVGKRSRAELAAEYVLRYEAEILAAVDLGAFAADLPADGRAALMCVERDPGACHRSLISGRLAREHGVDVVHLRPAS